MASPVEGDSFEIVQLPESLGGFLRPRAQRGAGDRAIGTDRDQAERMLLFVFQNEETPVGKLLDGGRLVKAGQVRNSGVLFRVACGILYRAASRTAARSPMLTKEPLPETAQKGYDRSRSARRRAATISNYQET
jgi:hypothetical protein